MARGNQRELARQKNMKKTQEISKGKRKEDSLTTSQRKQSPGKSYFHQIGRIWNRLWTSRTLIRSYSMTAKHCLNQKEMAVVMDRAIQS
ncbi:uncharacterized protein LOC101707966 isoform X2 [Heterocephalus glaber]|uniref:Uncharacterized protein LOC101707966 isoform X2 n=1 Tax=Heterocephalus glaber TaxID=10181 RepID=A0AAX6QMF9_HETGA|nr:uncharacterized protein LOC101707966 isoform X2 [Heterocephalus glaber]